ncbi:hypothetical protein [Bacillus cereus]|uniref:Uncharacterized protein n=1 Tax=Bacillus cereus TaxID=1396 RepID=A0A162P4P3_BACCE|nr:hypothetical protein [Bacillus cereus]KZD66373.1 hypothetical protein B4088_2489 [Bacillus cereus]
MAETTERLFAAALTEKMYIENRAMYEAIKVTYWKDFLGELKYPLKWENPKPTGTYILLKKADNVKELAGSFSDMQEYIKNEFEQFAMVENK